MKSSLLLLLAAVALVVAAGDGQGAFASGPGKNSGASHCGSVPEDGEQWLQPLCKAIHRIAAGKKEDEIKVGDGTTVRSAKLWRNANGTTVDIDFGGGTVGSAVIARLLSGSAFVPTDRVDKLVLRNASLVGTLDLSHATIEVAAKFNGVIFGSEKQQCDPEVLDADIGSFVLVGAHVKKQLIIEKGVFCGKVNIVSSQLDGGLHIGRGPDTADGFDEGKTAISSLFILKSDIDGEIRLGPAEATGIVRFDRSTIDALTIVDTKFNDAFQIIDNHLGALSVWSSEFGDEVSIHDNAVEASMKLHVLHFVGETRPAIRDNEIDGGLKITIRGIEAADADLSQNTVARSAQIWLPQRRPGSVDLSGSVFRSKLALCLARFDMEKDTLNTIPAEVDTGREGSCGESGDASEVTTIDLRSVQVGTLAWRLPLKCSFRWDGSGLRYQHWEETPAEASDSDFECRDALPSEAQRTPVLIGSTEGLMRMRHLMKENDVDALNIMADYLESRGKIVESRDIREEAKRANYLNIPEQAGILDEWSRRAAALALAPVGYGAKPELALIWLFGIWLGSFCIYTGYSYSLRADWNAQLEAENAAHATKMKVVFVRRVADQRTPIRPPEQIEAQDETVEERGGRELLVERREDSSEQRGYSRQPGFMQFDKEKDPKDFDIFRYSIDAMLPVINLHTYDRYYPKNRWLRIYAAAQHAVGWFLITIFLVSAAIL